MTTPLLDLQSADTTADQLRHRRTHLPEQERLDVAVADLQRWEQSLRSIRSRLTELAAGVDDAERRSAELDTKKSKLLAQLKTVIAPREAEALQSEIATIDRARSELDDVELEALEQQAELDDDLQALLAQEAHLRAAHDDAAAAVSAAQADIDAELGRIDGRLQELRAAVDATMLARYDHLRLHHIVAAARLVGTRCEGCHLDLSAGEVDEARSTAAAAGGVADCPYCSRLLVV